MNKHYAFKSSEIENIVKRFGRNFYYKVLKDLDKYAIKWTLTKFELFQSYSANLVFKCFSEYYGDVVLKIGDPLSNGIILEYNTLREYNGKPFCKVFDADLSNGVILEEYVSPGTPLRDENCLEKRLSVFCDLYKELHKPPAAAELYPTYLDWVCNITEYMSSRHDCKEFYMHMAKAREICLSLSRLYDGKMLLHGDFHHDNILMGSNGHYTIIDPKGVIGDPIFDVPRFILNEFNDDFSPELYKKIDDIICTLEDKLNIPNDMIKKCLYVETVMGNCWSIEDGATKEEFPELMKSITFSQSILEA